MPAQKKTSVRSTQMLILICTLLVNGLSILSPIVTRPVLKLILSIREYISISTLPKLNLKN